MPKKAHGKNKKTCEAYRSAGIKEKNQIKKQKRHEKRIVFFENRRNNKYDKLPNKDQVVIDNILNAENPNTRTGYKKIHTLYNKRFKKKVY